VCVDMAGETLFSCGLLLCYHALREFISLHSTGFTGQIPEHLHGCAVQNLREETGHTGNCGSEQRHFDINSRSVCLNFRHLKHMSEFSAQLLTGDVCSRSFLIHVSS